MRPDAIESRACEFRVADGGTGLAVLEGTALPYGQRAKVGPFTEEFRAGSLRLEDVIANVMHVRTRPLARQGHGLTLTDTPEGLQIRMELPDTSDGRDALTLVRNGVLQGLSVEFRAKREQWQGLHRIVHKAIVTGVALADRPAYAGATLAEGRSMSAAEWLELRGNPVRKRAWRSL